MTELTKGTVEHGSSWSEAFVGGMAFGILGAFLVPGPLGVLLLFLGFVGGFVVCRRLLADPSFRLRDIGAYVVLTLVSFSVALNLVDLHPGFPSVVKTEGLILYFACIPVAMGLAALELRVLRRSKRVPQFG